MPFITALIARIVVWTVAIAQTRIQSMFDIVTPRGPGVNFCCVILLQCDAPIRMCKSRTMAVKQEIKHRGNRARHASVPYSLYI